MTPWATVTMELLWRNALAVIPLTLLVAAIVRWLPCRATTRHTLWAIVLLWFLFPVVIPSFNLSPRDSAAVPFNSAPDGTPQGGRGHVDIRPVGAAGIAPQEIERFAVSDSPMETGTDQRRPANRSNRRYDSWRGIAAVSANERSKGPVKNMFDTATRERRLAAPRERTPTAGRARKSAARSQGGIAHGLTGPLGDQSFFQLQNRRVPQIAEDEPLEDVAVVEPRRVARFDLDMLKTVAVAIGRNALRGLIVVRDAVWRIPLLPASIWLTGALTVFIIRIAGMFAFQRRIRRADPAPPDVLHIVADCARRIGLPRVPHTMMISDLVSPMIWCGRHMCLLLPQGLWEQLDESGRRAVVLHELAHVSRADHWVCRLVWLVCGLYWWHPVAWWVRRRLEEEADLCCDAWVVWLCPKQRRVYAEALLATKSYLSQGCLNVPAMGVGVLSPRARRFAHRIRRVMTESPTPRLSVWGGGLACLLSLTGWLITPERLSGGIVEIDTGVATADEPSSQPNVEARPGESNTDTLPVPGFSTDRIGLRVHDGPPLTDWDPWVFVAEPEELTLSQRLDRIEQGIDRIGQQLAYITQLGLRRDGVSRPDLQNWAQADPLSPNRASPSSSRWRVYQISNEHRNELGQLFAKSNVIVRTPQVGQCIEVYATEHQHAVIAAFVSMIDPDTVVIPADLAQSAPAEYQLAVLQAYSQVGSQWEPVLAESVSRALTQRATVIRERAELFQSQSESLAAQQEELKREAMAIQDQARDLLLQASAAIEAALRIQEQPADDDSESQESSEIEISTLLAEAGLFATNAEMCKVRAAVLTRSADDFLRQAAKLKSNAATLHTEANLLDQRIASLRR